MVRSKDVRKGKRAYRLRFLTEKYNLDPSERTTHIDIVDAEATEMPLVHQFIEDELALEPTHRGNEHEDGVRAREEQDQSSMDPEGQGQQASPGVEHVGEHAKDV